MDVQEANLYQLRCGDLSVTYSTSSIAGTPQLTYTLGTETRTFDGSEIQVEETGLGRLVTVTLGAMPDLGSETFSILVPQVNIRHNATVPVTSIAIWTSHRTSIGGPGLVDGALQHYRAQTLEGTAQQVEF